MAGPRPFGVTLVAIITWINGLLGVIPGVIYLIGGGEPTTGWITVILGVLTIIVGSALLSGRNWARILVTILFVLSLVSAVYLGVTVPSQLWQAVLSGVLALVGLGLLWSRKASAFFH